MFSALRADQVLERLSKFWTHRAWKVRHGVLQTVAEAVSSGVPGILASKPQNDYLITQVGAYAAKTTSSNNPSMLHEGGLGAAEAGV